MSASSDAPDGVRTFSPALVRQYLDDMALTYPREHWTGVFALAESLLKLVEEAR